MRHGSPHELQQPQRSSESPVSAYTAAYRSGNRPVQVSNPDSASRVIASIENKSLPPSCVVLSDRSCLGMPPVVGAALQRMPTSTKHLLVLPERVVGAVVYRCRGCTWPTYQKRANGVRVVGDPMQQKASKEGFHLDIHAPHSRAGA